MDTLALLLALSAAAWLALRRRSRAGLFVLSIASLVYFGFVRRGCICPVGSLQNVLYALVDRSYAIPAATVVFFTLPIAFALVGGRLFCSGVCPLGVIQDLVLIRPVRLPEWLARALGLLAPVFLGVALLAVVTGSDFLICRFDPFVGIFRLSAEPDMAIAGIAVLALATVVGRPYCRFLCPYSVLLKLASRLSYRHLSTTPTECVSCGLCVKACPFGAISRPVQATPARPGPRELRELRELKHMALLLALVPVAAAAGAAVGFRASELAALMHPTVREAREVRLQTEAGAAFLDSGTPVETLLSDARGIAASFGPLTALLGALVGLLIAGSAVATAVRRPRTGYTPHRAHCVSCGRCFAACPKEAEKRGLEERERRALAAQAGRSRVRA